MKITVDSTIAIVLVLCAVVVTGILVRREFFAHESMPMQATASPVYLRDWHTYLSEGIRIGPQDAPVQLVEFSDFECPFCSSFHETLQRLRERYPKKVALIYIHFPLPMHRFAHPAARAAECAAAQGRFEPMHDLLFDQQDQLGLRSWTDFATEAGVLDTAAFNACIKSAVPITRVEEGKALGKQLGIQATPTLIVNGWKLSQPPSLEELDRMVKAILAGNSAISASE